VGEETYRAVESRVHADAGIVPFHPAVSLRDLQDLLILRDLDPIPRQRNQPLHKQFMVVPRRTGTSSSSNNNNIRSQRNAQELRGGGEILTGRRRRRRGRGRSGRGSASPPARVRPAGRPGWGTWRRRPRGRRRHTGRRRSCRARCRWRSPSRTAKRRPMLSSPCAERTGTRPREDGTAADDDPVPSGRTAMTA
jgi:hypothetical protein